MIRLVVAALVLAASLPLTAVGLRPAKAREQILLVFAAASLKNALDEANAAFAQATGIKPVTSYAASSALVKQIEQGAPADVFVSADLDWMDYGARKGLIAEGTRVNLLGNGLVLIAPKDAPLPEIRIESGFDLAKLAGGGRIAVGDVRAVPVGRYAKAALESLGVWPAVEPKLAMTENVRAALALVGRNEAPLGIVYETDAKIDPGVKIIGHFPESSHPPIIYPAAATKTARPEAMRYLAFLRSAAVRAIFERYGFTVLIKPAS
ncbi:MAG: molybdate ABC transporter substrate-binding protein [Variibacter sp.]|nr:molybdate ABC transporter substrate-binding protein [Variibacter sp.]